MLLAARDAIDFMTGIDEAALMASRLHQNAVIRSLEVIGEAARDLPSTVTQAIPEVEWSRTVAFRDVIARHSFGLDPHVVWDLVQTKIPDIARSCSAALARFRRAPERLS